MNGFLLVLLFSAMPALANFGGGLLAEFVPVSQRTLSLALHAAAGIVLAVISVELMPEAMTAAQPWVVILAFILGGGFFLLVDNFIGFLRRRSDTEGASSGAWIIYFGVAIDLFSDGLIIGTGSTIETGLGLLLALGQVPADVPEGFAAIATFKEQGVSRRTRLFLSASFTFPILLGATLGFWVVQGRPDLVKLALLAFTAGILVTVAVEEIVPQAHSDDEARLATLLFVLGFALFAFLSAYLG